MATLIYNHKQYSYNKMNSNKLVSAPNPQCQDTPSQYFTHFARRLTHIKV